MLFILIFSGDYNIDSDCVSSIFISEIFLRDVRKAILSVIGISKITITDILERTRDVHEEVRKHAYTVLGMKVPVDKLSISQRIILLKEGLRDRCESVQMACKELLCKHWLGTKSRSVDGNIIKLLHHLDIEENEEVAEDALKCLMQEGLVTIF